MQDEEVIQYRSGQCNIGRIEIKRRYRIGYLGLAMMIIFIIIAEGFQVGRLWRLFILVPAFYALSGFIQAWKKFCYVYGFLNVYSLKGRRAFTKIKDEDLIRKDRKTAIQIVLLVFLGSCVIAAAYYLMPF